MKQLINIILSGGGTGGHIYPAVAIANELKRRYPDARFLFVGAKDRMEMEKVPDAGYDIKGLWISGVQRKLTFSNLLFPFKLLSSLWKVSRIIKNFKPDVAVGTGGFASGPTLYIAAKNKIPTLIQEQNSYPGITNKLLGKKADKICVAYDNLEYFFPKGKIIKTGNPVRQDLVNLKEKRGEALSFFGLDDRKKTLLVLGGSLGARNINRLIADNIVWLLSLGIQLIWQTGKLYIDDYQSFSNKKSVQTHAFLNRMDWAYAAADIIISRAGASVISELCVVGKPVLFIPSPNVAEDHQTKNAMTIVEKEAALLIEENNLESFREKFKKLITDEALQQKLGSNIKTLELPKAAEHIADEVEKLLGFETI